jgi:hypothetical protein
MVSHLDFGRPGDIWLCILWDLGLPSVSQFAQATPSSLAGRLGRIDNQDSQEV